MSEEATFDGAPERGTINFSVGQPSADLLPLALLATAGQRFFADAEPLELNYGQRQGDARFRAALADFLGESGGSPVDPDSLMLTGGISQALDYVCSRLAKAGDVVFVEEPSYPYSFQIFRDHGLEVVGVPVDGAGSTSPDSSASSEAQAEARLHDPGVSQPDRPGLDRARRERLVALSREHGFLIIADEVYQLLHHGTPPPPSFGTLCRDGNVLALGTFSKILAPSLRLGWIQTTPELMQKMLASGALVSGGNFNHFTSHVVRQLMESGELSIRAGLRASYERAQAMDAVAQASSALRAGRSPPAAISSGSSCRRARTAARSRRRRAPRVRASCPAPSVRCRAASGIAFGSPSRTTPCRRSTRASGDSRAPSSNEVDPVVARESAAADGCGRHEPQRHPAGRAASEGAPVRSPDRRAGHPDARGSRHASAATI
jgi:aspartate/methionine/tyrosine aminotransferase